MNHPPLDPLGALVRHAALGGPVEPSTGALTPLNAGEVQITGGFWAEKQRTNADAILEHCRSWMDRIGWLTNFDRAADNTIGSDHAGVEFVDSEVYKLLEAMAWELGRRPSRDLESTYRSLVQRVVAAQEPDGYLHTAFGRTGQRPRYSDLEWGHELYCFGHLFQAAVARLRSGIDDALPAAARRLADHLWREFGPDGRDAICGHPEIELGLVELGRATGESRYVELARLFIARRGHGTLAQTIFHGSDYFLDDVPIRDAHVLRGHAVRAVYLAAGAIDVAVETSDNTLLQAVQRQWEHTVARRTYLTGGLGSRHENESIGDDFELPADRAYAETCAAIGAVMLDWRLLLVTGEPRYADLIERTLLNAVLVGPSSEGTAFFYANTLHQRLPGLPQQPDQVSKQAESGSRAPWFEVSCCPTNIARTLASAAHYLATKTPTGIQLHQYGDYTIDAELDSGSRARLRIRSDYPASGRVEIEILADTTLDLTLRIPAWADHAQLRSPKPSTHNESTWTTAGDFAAGDRIALELPMRTRTIRADPRIDATRGAFAFQRGPQVLCVESVDLPIGVDLGRCEVVRAHDEHGIPTLELEVLDPSDTPWPYTDHDSRDRSTQTISARLRPYATWGNRGPTAMRVWIPEHRRRDSLVSGVSGAFGE